MYAKPILLVEDNEDDEKLTLRALRKSEVANEVVIARDGAEACRLLAGPEAQSYGLILLDLRLPKLHGLEVLKTARAGSGSKLTPIVVLTSSREDSDIENAYAMGANSYVRKPADFMQFVLAMRLLSEYWLKLNETPPQLVRSA